MKSIQNEKIHQILVRNLVHIVSETNGISLNDTLELLAKSTLKAESKEAWDQVDEFRHWVSLFQVNKATMTDFL